ncbi:MAG TPA: Tol-Pal system beta propeller repeat protein TolB, partial [Geobacteraceae bacterium]|nr:Tol-Pal system beta propeller repeat protein TolB [Geobacteraceae bacterium]
MTIIARISCLVLLLVTIFPSFLFSQNDYMRVTAPGNRQLRLAIALPTSTAGNQDTKPAAEIAELLTFDLEMTGIFQVIPQAAASDADLILKTAYTATADKIILEYRLVEVQTGREVVAKRYSAARQDLRRTGHTFADDIVSSLTGERSCFTAKLAFVSTASGNKEIYLMDWDGYNVRKLTSNGSINLNPDFSPSGRELIYTSYKKGNPDLYRRELFTGSEARISSSSGINITGAYSPDGNRISLAMSKDGNSEIYLISKEGKQLARLT